MVIYSYMDAYGRAATLYLTSAGVRVLTNTAGAILPDDEIPALISALQGYMSRRAREMAKGGNGGR